MSRLVPYTFGNNWVNFLDFFLSLFSSYFFFHFLFYFFFLFFCFLFFMLRIFSNNDKYKMCTEKNDSHKILSRYNTL